MDGFAKKSLTILLICFVALTILMLPGCHLDTHSTSKKVTYTNEVITFPDFALEQTIRDAIDKPSGDITQADLNNLTHLSATNICTNNFQNLSGIEHCVNLQSLEIIGNDSDLTPLENLHNLKSLELFSSAANLAPLRYLVSCPLNSFTYESIDGIIS